MECRAVVSSLSDYLDGRNIWMSDDEVEQIETHLTNCPACRNLKLEFSEIKNAACELPLHTPAPALWTRISNSIESEISIGSGRVRENQNDSGWWKWLTTRKFTFSLPQLAAAGGLAAILIVGKVSGIFGANQQPLNLTDVQSALLLPEEDKIRADLERRLRLVNERKAQWDSRRRADFEQQMNKIEESLELCRRNKLEGDPNDSGRQEMVRALYEEQRKLLEDIERLKW
ncbi:MAG TPA: zf-HC2 domain-containing protein [Blastocatellia bacterium]